MLLSRPALSCIRKTATRATPATTTPPIIKSVALLGSTSVNPVKASRSFSSALHSICAPRLARGRPYYHYHHHHRALHQPAGLPPSTTTTTTTTASSMSAQQQPSPAQEGGAPPAAQEGQQQHQPPLPLPAPGDEEATTTVEVNGAAVRLDRLGPLVVNRDGTASRIANWPDMTDAERRNTLRVLGRRNQLRVEALLAGGDGGEAGTGA